jgi:hypothetical protein
MFSSYLCGWCEERAPKLPPYIAVIYALGFVNEHVIRTRGISCCELSTSFLTEKATVKFNK